MDEPKYYANITAKYKDSNAHIKFSDFKSKKKGSTWTQMTGGLLILAYQRETIDRLRSYWDQGIVEKEISHYRKLFIETNGEKGISKTDALRAYKVILEKLSKEQLEKKVNSFDHFTRKELGITEEKR